MNKKTPLILALTSLLLATILISIACTPPGRMDRFQSDLQITTSAEGWENYSMAHFIEEVEIGFQLEDRDPEIVDTCGSHETCIANIDENYMARNDMYLYLRAKPDIDAYIDYLSSQDYSLTKYVHPDETAIGTDCSESYCNLDQLLEYTLHHADQLDTEQNQETTIEGKLIPINIGQPEITDTFNTMGQQNLSQYPTHQWITGRNTIDADWETAKQTIQEEGETAIHIPEDGLLTPGTNAINIAKGELKGTTYYNITYEPQEDPNKYEHPSYYRLHMPMQRSINPDQTLAGSLRSKTRTPIYVDDTIPENKESYYNPIKNAIEEMWNEPLNQNEIQPPEEKFKAYKHGIKIGICTEQTTQGQENCEKVKEETGNKSEALILREDNKLHIIAPNIDKLHQIIQEFTKQLKGETGKLIPITQSERLVVAEPHVFLREWTSEEEFLESSPEWTLLSTEVPEQWNITAHFNPPSDLTEPPRFPGTPITHEKIDHCGEITEPGNYTLIKNLQSDGICLRVNADDVTINGNGRIITGEETPEQPAIYIENQADTEIQDLTIENFSDGIYIDQSSQTTVNNINVEESENGIIISDSHNNKVANSTFRDTPDAIFLMESNENILDSNVLDDGMRGDSGGIRAWESSNNLIKNNMVSSSGEYGLLIQEGSQDNQIENNLIYQSWEEDLRVHEEATGNTGRNMCDETQVKGDNTVHCTGPEDVDYDVAPTKIEFLDRETEEKIEEPLEPGRPVLIKATYENVGNTTIKSGYEHDAYFDLDIGTHQEELDLGSISRYKVSWYRSITDEDEEIREEYKVLENWEPGQNISITAPWVAVPAYNKGEGTLSARIKAYVNDPSEVEDWTNNELRTTPNFTETSSGYTINPDTYSFENFGAGVEIEENRKQQRLAALEQFLDHPGEFILRLAGGLVSSTEIEGAPLGIGESGHCYGMSETSSLYYMGDKDVPGNKEVIELDLNDSGVYQNILSHQMRLGGVLDALSQRVAGKITEFTPGERERRYAMVKHFVDEGIPPLALDSAHATTAFSTYRVSEDIKNVLIYDSNRPGRAQLVQYNISGDYFKTPDPLRKSRPDRDRIGARKDGYLLYRAPDPLKEDQIKDFADSVDSLFTDVAEAGRTGIFTIGETVSLVEGTQELGKDLFSFGSPVEIEIMDQQGNKLNMEKNEIPGAEIGKLSKLPTENQTLNETGNRTVATLPTGQDYTINIQGTGKGTLEIDNLVPLINREDPKFDVNTETNITITENTEATLTTKDNTLEIDENGDGETDKEIQLLEKTDRTREDIATGTTLIDEQGRKINLQENEIPNATVEQINDVRLFMLPSNQSYTADTQANTHGRFNLIRVEETNSSTIATSPSIKINSKTQIETDIPENNPNPEPGFTMKIDQHGDGEVDREVEPKEIIHHDPPSRPQPQITITEKQNHTVTLDATKSTKEDGEITNYKWNLGDGETKTGEVITHTYTETGEYAVKLTTTGEHNQTNQDYALVYIEEPTEEEPPKPPEEPEPKLKPMTTTTLTILTVAIITILAISIHYWKKKNRGQ